MKPLILSLLIAVQLVNLPVQGQETSQQPGQTTIYFYRLPNFAGSGIKITISLNGEPVVRLRNGSFFKVVTEAGNYEITTGFGGSTKLLLRAEPGATYYIKSYLNMGFWSGIPILELTEPTAGRAVIEGRMLAEQQPENVVISKPVGSLGLTLGGGFGFERIALFIDENNDKVYLSSGGGFSIGGEFNHNIGNLLNLSFQAFYQGSTLSRSLSNASASFNRIGITITPALIIPIRGGEQFRLLAGVGAGMYTATSMKVDESELGGEKITLRYNSPLALHASMMFNVRFAEKGEMGMGLRYYNIKYDFRSEGSTNIPGEDEFLHPNGSGLDFILAYYFKY